VSGDPTFWIEARASGLLALLLLTTSVIAGLVLKSRPFGSALKPATVTDIHRFLAMLCLGATAIHGAALVLDSSVHISVVGLLVPGFVPYRPVWVAVGVVAAELMALVYASFSQRKRIGVKTWRRLHWSTYGIFAAMVVHGVMSGTDTRQPWALGIYLGAIGAVVMATAWRILVPPAKPVRAGRTVRMEAGSA
jgi:sulfoxide reductase heme-binding subunit YedZ